MNRQLTTLIGVVAAVAWLAIIGRGLFDFSAPDALAAVRENLGYLPDVFTHIPRNAGDLFPVLLFLVSGFGVGDLIVAGALKLRARSLSGRAAFALCAGLICWTAAIIAVGTPGFLNRPVLGTLLGAGLVVTAVRLYATRGEWAAPQRAAQAAPVWLRAVIVLACVLLAFDLYLAFLGALTPEVQFDARFYHLAEAKRYADHGMLFNLAASQGSVETALPQNQETLYAAVYALFGLHAAKVLSWSNLLLTVLAIFGFAAEFFGSVTIGLLASLFFVSTPIVAWSASTASNDLSLAPYTLLSVYAVALWRERGGRGALVVAGLLSGFAFGIKPFSLITAVLLALFLCLAAFRANGAASRKTALRIAAIALALFVGGCAIGALPGMVREYAITGDPIYPLAGRITHSPFWAPALAQANASSIHDFGADTSWSVLPKLPWVLTMRPDLYRNIIGPLLLFILPFVLAYALLRRANPLYRQLVVFLVLWALLWFATGLVEARYAEALFPVTVLLAAFVAIGEKPAHDRVLRAVLLALLLVITAVNTQILVPFQRSATLGYVSGYIPFLWSYLYDRQPESDVQLVYAPMIAYANEHLNPRKDKIYFATEDAYFNVYSDIDIYDGMTPLGALIHPWNLLSPNAYEKLRRANVDYVAIYEGQESDLKAAPLYRNLAQVLRLPPAPGSDGKPDSGEILYKIR